MAEWSVTEEMNDPAPQTPPPQKPPGAMLGVAGCGITFMLTALGGLVGGVIGLLRQSPMPPRGGEYDGLLYWFASFFNFTGGLLFAGIGAVIGGAVGFVLGMVMAMKHVRRVKAETKTPPASHE